MTRAGSSKGYREVAGVLREQIRQGRIPPGAKLPSIEDLEREHQASRNVVRDALKQLSQERLIETKQGVGSTVLAEDEWTTTEAADLMQLVAALRDEVRSMREEYGLRIEAIERRLP